jgi:hypothetical protein
MRRCPNSRRSAVTKLAFTRGPLAAVLALLLAVACGGSPAAPTSLYWPTFADYQVANFPKSQNVAPPFRRSLELWFLEYAIVYAATECVTGRELSSEGFRAFVGGEYNAIRAKTNRVIGQMLALSASGARLDCLKPYLHPTTGTEVSVAVDLVYAAGSGHVGGPFQGYYRWTLNELAFSWFREGAQQRQPILQRFRDAGHLKNVEIPARVPVPKNTRGLNVQAWAIERQAWDTSQTKN